MFTGFTGQHIYNLRVIDNKLSTEAFQFSSSPCQDAGKKLEGKAVLLIYLSYLERKPVESPWLTFLSIPHIAFPSASECVSM